jgi:hypothetical protein
MDGICKQLSLVVNNKLESVWKGVVVALLKYRPSMFLQGPRKTTKNLRRVGTLSEIRKGSLLKRSRKYYPLHQFDWSTQWRFFSMAQEPLVDQGLIIEASRSHPDKSNTAGLLWTSDQLVIETST